MTDDLVRFLSTASEISLENFALSRRNLAANLKKEIRAVIEQIIEEEAAALVAQLVRDRRRELFATGSLREKFSDPEREARADVDSIFGAEHGRVTDAAD
jgi:hypothetical protein